MSKRPNGQMNNRTSWRQRASLLFALVLIVANGGAWLYALAPEGPAVVVDPQLEPDLADLRQRLIEGGHNGEPFSVEVTDLEAAQTIAWYLARHPRIPFRDPQVAIAPGGVTATGAALKAIQTVAGR